jgi:hypothetical protein
MRFQGLCSCLNGEICQWSFPMTFAGSNPMPDKYSVIGICFACENDRAIRYLFDMALN